MWQMQSESATGEVWYHPSAWNVYMGCFLPLLKRKGILCVYAGMVSHWCGFDTLWRNKIELNGGNCFCEFFFDIHLLHQLMPHKSNNFFLCFLSGKWLDCFTSPRCPYPIPCQTNVFFWSLNITRLKPLRLSLSVSSVVAPPTCSNENRLSNERLDRHHLGYGAVWLYACLSPIP